MGLSHKPRHVHWTKGVSVSGFRCVVLLQSNLNLTTEGTIQVEGEASSQGYLIIVSFVSSGNRRIINTKVQIHQSH